MLSLLSHSLYAGVYLRFITMIANQHVGKTRLLVSLVLYAHQKNETAIITWAQTFNGQSVYGLCTAGLLVNGLRAVLARQIIPSLLMWINFDGCLFRVDDRCNERGQVAHN